MHHADDTRNAVAVGRVARVNYSGIHDEGFRMAMGRLAWCPSLGVCDSLLACVAFLLAGRKPACCSCIWRNDRGRIDLFSGHHRHGRSLVFSSELLLDS